MSLDSSTNQRLADCRGTDNLRNCKAYVRLDAYTYETALNLPSKRLTRR